jgi:flavodoxin
MKAVVVYESLWGNTAAVAGAIAEGLGEGAVALSTGAADAAALEGADLIVAGAPILGFNLPTEGMRANIAKTMPGSGLTPDLSSASMRS